MPDNFIERRIEDLIIFYLVFTKVLQFFGLISILEPLGIYPEVVDFIDIIVSFTGLAYVLYKVSPTDIFFGEKHKTIDLMIIGSYFLLIANKFVEFSVTIVKDLCGDLFCMNPELGKHFLFDFFRFVTDNGQSIEIAGFYIGGTVLILLAFYIAFKVQVKEPSILDALHGENMTKPKKLITSFIVMVSFYLIFFNITMEWLTRVLDAPFILIALFFYIFKIHDIGKNMDSEAVLFKISDVVENLTEKFVGLFHDKKTIFLGISLILVLHLVSDVSSFVIPYTLGTSSQYHEGLGENHNTLPQLFMMDKENLDNPIIEIFALFGYAFNVFAILFLMVFPAYMWYVIYLSHSKENINPVNFPNVILALFYSSLVFYIFLPVFKITSLSSALNIFGVDIQTNSILASGNNLSVYLGIAISIFLVILLLLSSAFIKELIIFFTGIVNLGFFGIYVYNFFISIYEIYLVILDSLIKDSSYFIAFFIVIFLMINVAFYIGGYISFVISSFKG
jgi:hypothetical protein